MEKFLYKMAPDEEESESTRTGRTESTVLTKPRTLTIIKQEEDSLLTDVEQREESRVSMEAFLSGKGGIPAPPIETIGDPLNFSHQGSSLTRSSIKTIGSTKPRMRERDLSDTEFYYVYGLTRLQFKKLGVFKRAWLRSENMHRRPFAENNGKK